jgi:eukaryotic-like serine/threonine-protein kinase
MIAGLLELKTTSDPALRRSAWRASLASLAQACSCDIPGPLDGLSSAALDEGLELALRDGLLDEVSFLAPSAAAAAIYELSTVLPRGVTRRELERRVLDRLHEGDAATFVAVATRMSLGAGAGLASWHGGGIGSPVASGGLVGEAVRARVALVAALPPSSGVRVDRLALSLLSRRDSARTWVDEPSRGSLPDRRMAGRLLEQAAWGIARQISQGDDWPLRLLRGEAFGATLPRLLADREPLVFRHPAIARGLLSRFHAPYQAAIEAGLKPGLTPTEWRRSLASLAASAAFEPGPTLDRLRQAISEGLLARDPGAVSAICWGAAAAAEAEPAIAGDILELACDAAPLFAAEAIVELGGARLSFAAAAVARVRRALDEATEAQGASRVVDDGQAALHAALLDELRGDAERPISDAVALASAAFVEQGARAAFAAARDAVDQADGGVATLELLDAAEDDADSSGEVRRRAFVVLRDIDNGFLHDGTLDDLLMLERRDGPSSLLPELTRVRDRVAAWVLEREGQRRSRAVLSGDVPHLTLRLSQLRTLIYAADARTMADVPRSQASGRIRRQRIATLMLRRLADGPHQQLRRATCAAFARAVDSLVRGGDLDPADVCLVIAQIDLPIEDISVIAEASANADVSAMLRAFLPVVTPSQAAGQPPLSLPPTRRIPGAPSADGLSLPPLTLYGPSGERLQALVDFARLIDADASGRTESFRSALLRFCRALASVLAASTLSEVVDSEGGAESTLVALDASIASLLQLAVTSEQRMGLRTGAVATQARQLAPAIAAVVGQGRSEAAAGPIAAAQQDAEQLLPPLLGALASPVIASLEALPLGKRGSPSLSPPREQPLPPWIPPHRTIGGYFILAPIGAGGAGSVFIVRRVEDRHEPKAERFALKVPEYEGSAARTLSEAQFLQLFREEASALLGLPHHPNLARFVTFDLAARPKPILVMELVEGMSLDEVIGRRALDTPGAFALLDGVLAGLEAMHGVGVGHLDIKPQNVILRGGREPVLVDFGLAGRKIRPGCATLAFGAPEIWVGDEGGASPSPLPADVYAAACLCFELLLGAPLFDASSEIVAVTAHLSHDGLPERLRRLAAVPGLSQLAELLRAGLRREPGMRVTVPVMRRELGRLAGALSGAPWPLLGDISSLQRTRLSG